MTTVERFVDVDGARIFAQGQALHGTESAVLIAGAAMQATAWDDRFIAALTDRGIAVICFDWRDIGLSTWQSFKEHPYSVETLADDVVQVARAFDRIPVHLVGFSMGGCIAQLVTLRSPRSVRSLSLLSSGYASIIDADRGERGRELFRLFALPRPTNNDEHVDRLVEQWRLLRGPGVDFDQVAWTQQARDWVARGQNPSCPHLRLGPQVFGVDRTTDLARITIPTLVLHGTDDPMFPSAHGEAIARAIPAADLELFTGRGHDLHLDPNIARRVADHILQTANSDQSLTE